MDSSVQHTLNIVAWLIILSSFVLFRLAWPDIKADVKFMWGLLWDKEEEEGEKGRRAA